MATAEATREFSAPTKDLGDKIVALTLKQAKELSDYLEEVHGIKPAAGGAVMMAGPGGGGGGAGRRRQDRVRRRAGRLRRQEDRRDQGRPRADSLGLKEAKDWSKACPARSRKASPRKTPRRSRRSWKRPARRSRSSSDRCAIRDLVRSLTVSSIGAGCAARDRRREPARASCT